jgi:hypothetical protein
MRNERTRNPSSTRTVLPSDGLQLCTRQNHFPGRLPSQAPGFLPREGSPVSPFHPCAPSTCILRSYHDDRFPTTTPVLVLTRFSSLDIKKSCGKAATIESTGQNLPPHNSGVSNSMDIKGTGRHDRRRPTPNCIYFAIIPSDLASSDPENQGRIKGC